MFSGGRHDFLKPQKLLERGRAQTGDTGVVQPLFFTALYDAP